MADEPKVLTETGKIPDTTAEVKKATADVAVTQEQHVELQKEADTNRAAIADLKVSDVNTQASRDEEAQRNREAIAQLQVKQDILDGKYSKSQPVSPTTTSQEDLTLDSQRQIALIWAYSQSIIAVLIVLAFITVLILQAVGIFKGDFPVVLASAVSLILGFFLAKQPTIGGAPINVQRIP